MARPNLGGDTDSLRQMLAALADGRKVWVDGEQYSVDGGKLFVRRRGVVSGVLGAASELKYLSVAFHSWSVDAEVSS